MRGVHPERKPVHWIGSSREDLRELSEEIRSVFGFAIDDAALGETHVDAEPLRGFGGAGVLEVVASDRGNTYRAVYTVRLRSAVYVLHVFEKKSKQGIATPKKEIDKVRARLKLAIEHHRERYED